MKSVLPAVIFAIAGGVLGFFITQISEKIAEYKMKKTGGGLAKNDRFTSLLLKAVLAAANAGAWAATAYTASGFLSALLISLLITLAVIISVVDIRIRIIPNELILTMLIIGTAFQLVQFGLMGALSALICMAAAVLLFTAAALVIGLQKIGAGDIKLAGAIGMALGFPAVITAMAVMSVSIILFCVLGLMAHRLKRTSMLPYAPFFMLGLVASLALIIF